MADLAPSATCVSISYDAGSNQRVYVVEGAWSSGSCYGQVLVIAGEYGDLVAAAGGVSAPSTPTAQFTEEEVTSLKYQASNPSPFNLSIPDGTLVSGAIAGTWALAWVIKQLVRALNTDGEKEST
ncbi:hypothetical protein [Aquabacterium sp. CECT 9606]|uniref:hypothetical protein n=1 Tax=Aquabacterium sp. CECT 9606 TaxID=2845822 RepID=UPI001E4D1B62|nr:hypothetical protein [Aquabacterium sp. CECT 9606]CAH0352815.1 hypothetical protein AQB9606_02828 [Aquabacterium sp. CECT 9606]